MTLIPRCVLDSASVMIWSTAVSTEEPPAEATSMVSVFEVGLITRAALSDVPSISRRAAARLCTTTARNGSEGMRLSSEATVGPAEAGATYRDADRPRGMKGADVGEDESQLEQQDSDHHQESADRDRVSQFEEKCPSLGVISTCTDSWFRQILPVGPAHLIEPCLPLRSQGVEVPATQTPSASDA
jgi:hypothetical protein